MFIPENKGADNSRFPQHIGVVYEQKYQLFTPIIISLLMKFENLGQSALYIVKYIESWVKIIFVKKLI